jgi:hypothetical protein
MAVQLSDLDFWLESLRKKHRKLIVDNLDKVYDSWNSALYSSFKEEPEMRYASYYALVFSSCGVFLSPVMGVSDTRNNKKEGCVCIHPVGVHDALYIIRNFVRKFFNEDHSGSGCLFGDDVIIEYLNSHMGEFLYCVITEREDGENFEDMFEEDFEEVRCLFYYGSWLAWITFDPDGGYLIDEYNLPCEYRTPADTYEDSREEIFGFIVIPREDMFKLLEEQGLVIS